MRTAFFGLLALALVSGCSSLPKNDLNDIVMPSNFRTWSPEFARLPSVEIDGNDVTIRNVRNTSYLTENDYVLQFEDRTYRLDELEHVDFFVVPFAGAEFLAHTMLSFVFADGETIAVSAEIRTEKGEKYSPILGISRQYEITYVVADERDLVRLRTRYRDADVYLYRTLAPPEKARELFLDVASRINGLVEKPEFYHTLGNNCTTNIVEHVNRIAPNRVPYGMQVLLPGYSDRYAYELGLLDQSVPFAELKQEALINELATKYFDSPDFSEQIRSNLKAHTQPAGGTPLVEDGDEALDPQELLAARDKPFEAEADSEPLPPRRILPLPDSADQPARKILPRPDRSSESAANTGGPQPPLRRLTGQAKRVLDQPPQLPRWLKGLSQRSPQGADTIRH